MPLPQAHDVVAPDESEVRILLSLSRGSMAHFQLPAGRTARAVGHRTVEEIWYVLSGSGEMWRSNDHGDNTVALSSGTCLTIPVATRFQTRVTGTEPLAAVAITMPPWPGEQEAEPANGPWIPNV